MNRMGFINFWLYDEEIFNFENGKILLRGQNASGKSITTQSFIPFILDADRTPSRLDPFGSSDRRMEYYFLGDGEKEEATGYLFLEFKRENVDQYRTIGIGQRAQSGKPMAFWGFVLLDGRRIGVDIKLYQEVGVKKIPYTKQKLKQVLGEENPYTEVQKEYMSFVNKYIFGFPNLEQYGQFIKLLIKVRAPKLSKEFKPSKVYDILNDSLQILSDEDLRAMVEAMEKMDEIQDRLDNLKISQRDLYAIRKEYIRYNHYMLGKKAQVYVEEKKKLDKICKKLDEKEEQILKNTQEMNDYQRENEEINDEIRILQTEKGTLYQEDLDISIDKLEVAKKKKQESREEKQKIESKIEDMRSQILIYDGKLREYQGNIDSCFEEIEKILEELEDENEILMFERHSDVKKVLDLSEKRREFRDLYEFLKTLEKKIEEGYTALENLQKAREQWSKEEEILQKLILGEQEAKSEYDNAQAMEIECRDRLIEAFYILSANNQELLLMKKELDEIIQMVRKYETPGEQGEIIEYFYKIWMIKNEELKEKKLKIEGEKKRSLEQRNLLLLQLEQLEKMETPAFLRKERVEEARNILREQKISFLPFYEAVDFKGELSKEDKNRLEGQLEMAGLLDALIVSKKDREKAKKALEGLSDMIISVRGEEKNPYPFFISVSEDSELRDATDEVLRHIFVENESEAEIVLAQNGYFRNGVLEGYCHFDEEASYVGATARKEKKKRLISEKREEIRQEDEKLAEILLRLDEIGQRISILEQEKEKMPSFADLNQAIDLVRSCEERVEKYERQIREQENISFKMQHILKEQEQKVIKACKPLPYFRTIDAYREAKNSVEVYRERLGDLEYVISDWETAKANFNHMQDLIQNAEDTVDMNYGYLKKEKRRLNELALEIQGLEDYLNNPKTKEMRERLEQIRVELKRKENQYNENITKIAVLNSELHRLEEEIRNLKETVDLQRRREKILCRYFEEELELGLVMEKKSDSIYDTAIEARDKIKEIDKNRSGVEMTTNLIKIFQAHQGSLANYGIELEECFSDYIEDSDSTMLHARQRISARWNGKKLYMEEFYNIIKDSIESTELLIQQKDRELFEGILADTLSRKLSSRIRESRAWIKDMSALMKSMDTSMALTFSLDWKPIKGQGEYELDTQELERIFTRDRELLTSDDIEKVSTHFRMKIHNAKLIAEENGETVNYLNLVRDALDYRKWFVFRMNYYRNDENKKELTNAAFNRFSGGEKAMAMYVPLFAAVNAQYKKAENKDHPRIIALDEAFAGVDDKNISSMFELVEQLDFDYIMNSQVLWGCYEPVKSLKIAELLRPANSDVVTVIYYHWNGHERILDEQ